MGSGIYIADKEVSAHLFVTFRKPGVVARHEESPILQRPNKVNSAADARQGLGVAGFPCEVDDKGGESEEDGDNYEAAGGQQIEQVGAEDGGHDHDGWRARDAVTGVGLRRGGMM